jgi:hypothetical protein
MKNPQEISTIQKLARSIHQHHENPFLAHPALRIVRAFSRIETEILWLKLMVNAALERKGGVPRVFVVCRKNTRFLRPIQHQVMT